MGTRCLTRVFDGDREVACIYRHYDGYPDGMGQDLVDMLGDKHVVNGYSSGAKLPKEQRLNGPGRVAALIVYELFEDGRDPDIMPPGTSEIWEDYEYHVKCPTLEAINALKGVDARDPLRNASDRHRHVGKTFFRQSTFVTLRWTSSGVILSGVGRQHGNHEDQEGAGQGHRGLAARDRAPDA